MSDIKTVRVPLEYHEIEAVLKDCGIEFKGNERVWKAIPKIADGKRIEAAPASSAMPKLTLALPDYEKRRIVIASDEMLDDDERLVCVAIDDSTASAMAMQDRDDIIEEAARVCDRQARSTWNDDRTTQAKLDASEIRRLKHGPAVKVAEVFQPSPVQPMENFCSRCGKRQNGSIHTCTPPDNAPVQTIDAGSQS